MTLKLRRIFCTLVTSLAGCILLVLSASGAVQALTSDIHVEPAVPQHHSSLQTHKNTLVVGSEQDYPPFATGMTEATAGGFTVDLWKAVAEEAGLRYTVRVLPFHQILQEFKDGKIDVLINLAISNDRHQFADFTVPHVVVHGAIFVRQGEKSIHTEDDMAGKSIIVLKADLAHDYAVSKGWEKHLVLVDTAAEGLNLLASGEHDAMLLSKLTGMQTVKAYELSNIKALLIRVGFAQKFAFAVPEGQSELLGKINEGLALTKSNGTYNRLYDKWFALYEEKEVGLRDLLKYLIPIAIVFLSIAGYFFYRRQIERKEAERKYRDLYDYAPDMFFSVEAKTATIIDCNQTLLNATGYTREELIGRPVLELYHPDCSALAKAAFQKFIESKEVHCMELLLRRKDGSKADVSLNASAVCDENGVILHSRSALRDITERKRMEAELRDSEERFRQLFEKAPIGIAMAKRDLKIFSANPAFLKIFGYTQEELCSMTIADLTHPEHVALTTRMVNGVLDGEVPAYSFDKKYVRKNGEVFWGQAIATEIGGGNAQTRYIMGMVEDISERVEQEEMRLAEVREQRDVLVREVHHRIKNSLQGVLGLLRRHAVDHPDTADVIDVTIGRIYSIAIIHGLQAQTPSEDVDLNDLIKCIVDAAGYQVQYGNALNEPVSLNQEEAVPLALVLNELVTNACKHRTENSLVTIGISASGDDIIIVISNHFDANQSKQIDGGQGMLLVKSLMPRKSAEIVVVRASDIFSVELILSPPVVIAKRLMN